MVENRTPISPKEDSRNQSLWLKDPDKKYHSTAKGLDVAWEEFKKNWLREEGMEKIIVDK